MDVHPTKNVSIGIDPYPCVNAVNFTTGKSGSVKERWISTASIQERGIQEAEIDQFRIHCITINGCPCCKWLSILCMYIYIHVLLCIYNKFLSLVSQPETNNLGKFRSHFGFTFDIPLHHLRGSDKCRWTWTDVPGECRICRWTYLGACENEHYWH